MKACVDRDKPRLYPWAWDDYRKSDSATPGALGVPGALLNSCFDLDNRGGNNNLGGGRI